MAASPPPESTHPVKSIPPGAWLGLLGGGQLGRMFCMAAQSLGYKVVVLDPGGDSPAGSVADRHIRADYLDPRGLAESGRARDARRRPNSRTFPRPRWSSSRTPRASRPPAASVAIAQDRISEKTFLAESRLRRRAVRRPALARATRATSTRALLPGIVKSARFGYDGKGQVSVRTRDDVDAAWRAMKGQPCVLEQRVRARLRGVGDRRAQRARRGGDLAGGRERASRRHPRRVDRAGARSAELAARARDIATRIATALDYRGVLCVEMFVTDDGALLVNEIAPRPHNSGHYTIDACVTSQFEQQARVLADLPLGATRQHTPAVMVNLLGDIWFDGADGRDRRANRRGATCSRSRRPNCISTARAEARRGRKMGHVTCLGATLDEALATARKVKRTLAHSRRRRTSDREATGKRQLRNASAPCRRRAPRRWAAWPRARIPDRSSGSRRPHSRRPSASRPRPRTIRRATQAWARRTHRGRSPRRCSGAARP